MDRVVVHKNLDDDRWVVWVERDGGGEAVSSHERFSAAHQEALGLGLPVYVPKYAYDPKLDEPGWNLPDGASRDEMTEFVHGKLRPA